MPSWIGPWEIGIVLVIVLLIFGPRKLPELGSSLGKSIRGFRKGMKDGEQEGDETVAEATEATSTSEASVSKSQAATATATTEAAAAVATAEATGPDPTAAEAPGSEPMAEAPRPQCFGTWEEGDADCQRCTIGTDCADAAAVPKSE
jgi:sec-independent protein translocase protein TatA